MASVIQKPIGKHLYINAFLILDPGMWKNKYLISVRVTFYYRKLRFSVFYSFKINNSAHYLLLMKLYNVIEIMFKIVLPQSTATFMHLFWTIDLSLLLDHVFRPTFLSTYMLERCWSAICQVSSTVSSASLPQHLWDPCILLPHQESEIHCLIICAIQLLTPNNLGKT